MGCAASSINKEKRVQRCKERKKLMKQLIGCRRELALALFDYLRALNNTGSTLGQFTESDSLEQEDVAVPQRSVLPPPPPPPPLSPDWRKAKCIEHVSTPQEEIIELKDDGNSTPPPPDPVSSSSLTDLYPFDEESMPELERIDDLLSGQVEGDEDWVDARTEFEEDDGRKEMVLFLHQQQSDVNSGPYKVAENVNDTSSPVTSMQTEDTRDRAVVVYRTKKTLVGIVRDLDEYFVKASHAGKELAVLMDVAARNTSKRHHAYGETKRKGNNSGRVFGSLAWIWSSRSVESSMDTEARESLSEPCRPGAHCITLDKLYAEEQKLHKALKEEATAKLELEKTISTLQKQEAEIVESLKVEKTRISVGNLQSAMTSLAEFISRCFSTILALTEQELHPQLIAILSGLLHLWRTMYECHQVQHHISQQMDHLTSHDSAEPTSDNRHKAVVQFAEKVSFWHQSFRRFLRYQRDCVKVLGGWIALVEVPVAAQGAQSRLSSLHATCVEWQRALEKLPEKAAEEVIKSFLSSVRSVISTHEEEFAQKKRSDKLGRRLQKELDLLLEMEEKLIKSNSSFVDYGGGGGVERQPSDLSPKHPLTIKRCKTQALKKAYDTEKEKYKQSVKISRATDLKNMKTSLPNVFQALVTYSAASVQAFEGILDQARQLSDDCVDTSHSGEKY